MIVYGYPLFTSIYYETFSENLLWKALQQKTHDLNTPVDFKFRSRARKLDGKNEDLFKDLIFKTEWIKLSLANICILKTFNNLALSQHFLWNIVNFINPTDRARNHILPLPRDSKIIRTWVFQRQLNFFLIISLKISNLGLRGPKLLLFCTCSGVPGCGLSSFRNVDGNVL